MKIYIVIITIIVSVLPSLLSADSLQIPDGKDCLNWGAIINDLRIGVAVRKDDWINPNLQTVLVTILVDGSRNSKFATVIMESRYHGVVFIKKSRSNSDQVLAGDFVKHSFSTPILIIRPNETSNITFEMNKKKLQTVIDQSAYAQISVNEYGIAPLKLEVAVLPPPY